MFPDVDILALHLKAHNWATRTSETPSISQAGGHLIPGLSATGRSVSLFVSLSACLSFWLPLAHDFSSPWCICSSRPKRAEVCLSILNETLPEIVFFSSSNLKGKKSRLTLKNKRKFKVYVAKVFNLLMTIPVTGSLFMTSWRSTWKYPNKHLETLKNTHRNPNRYINPPFDSQHPQTGNDLHLT